MESLLILVGRCARLNLPNLAQTRDVVATDKEPRRQISLLDLPTDMFLKLLEWLEIPDIFNLRTTCKGFKRLTQLHPTWAILATYHVIGNDLPWPVWALPLSDVPSATLEHLTLRALRMRRLWDGGNPKTKRKLSQFIQRPPESITWICLIRSRWLVIQQCGTILELWDLKDITFKQPTLTIDTFKGIVDGSVVRPKAECTITMMISTRSCEVGRIEFSLPYAKADGGSASARVVDSFGDFSQLMDADEQLAAFLQHQGNNGIFIRDMASGAVVRLNCPSENSQPQQPFGIQLKRQVVAVATVWSVDLYWRETIITALRSADGGSAAIQPFQRLTYYSGSLGGTPKEAPMASAVFLTNNPKFLPLPSGEDTIILSAQGSVPGRILYVAKVIETTERGSPSMPPTYFLLPPYGLFSLGPYTMLFYDPGQSGRRSVFVVDEPRGLSLCGISVPRDLSWPAQGSAKRGYIGWWRITDSSSRDLVHHVAFEEATGTCAIAMGSGRIWVVDLTAAEIMPQNLNEHLDIPAERVTPRADLAWLETPQLPWPTAIREQDYPDFTELSPEDWSTDVEAYYPSKNSPKCFGGATWFVNQALNIPGPATSLFFNIPAGRGQLSLGVEIIGFSNRLLAVIRLYDYDAYSVVLFDQGIQLEDIIMRLHEGESVRNLPCKEVPFDARPLERYAAWRSRVDPDSIRHMW